MKLTENQINERVKDLAGWKFENNSIKKTFEFGDFIVAMNFVNNVATLANIANHHPDIDIRYNKITITLSTHDERGVTEKDISLATRIESL